jgi:hypothetical protein
MPPRVGGPPIELALCGQCVLETTACVMDPAPPSVDHVSKADPIITAQNTSHHHSKLDEYQY